ncbi:ParA family protein [Pseudomonas oryzihabitans]|uniref:ParA family protein n=1 Tax=Pseudomonas oryzihabitans TaxID=47885 RepID=UPI0015E30749|nr:AAA family ATPase [Pseudomonas psychrotolerans]MBA1259868.1 AAA family ATPase [Pseudomonas psychrotolerans]
MKTVCFFNNKGGVGKTTLTGNIAAYLALEMGKRVLIIDCDPQCNITQFILGDTKTIELYWPENTQKEETKVKTVLDVVQPILDGDASINKSVKPIPKRLNRFGVDLLPGHPRFSLFEDPLSTAWTELPSGKAGGFRVSNWLRSYLAHFEDDYDIVLIDVSPSLGALNRSALLSCNYFVTPLGADAFSLLGLRNISRWMTGWIDYYVIGLEQAERLNPGTLERFNIPKDIRIQDGFVGYTLQQYIAKSKAGERRPTKAYERILSDIPNEVENFLKSFKHNINLDSHLGDVPNLYSLIPLAQSANAPIIALKAKDGLVGNQFSQAAEYKKIIGNLAFEIASRIN